MTSTSEFDPLWVFTYGLQLRNLRGKSRVCSSWFCIYGLVLTLRIPASTDHNRYHTRDDLLKHGVVNNEQHSKVTGATKEFLSKCKYLDGIKLQKTTILTEFMDKIGVPRPKWDPESPLDGFGSVNHWVSKVLPLSKFLKHSIVSHRQEMVKAVKKEIMRAFVTLPNV